MAALRQRLGQPRARGSLPDFSCTATHHGRRSTSSSREPIPGECWPNVYFNPGDDGTAMGFGYRGSPCRIDLGFDATADFHLYAIDWRPGRLQEHIGDGVRVGRS
jgi:hypothetical protein